MSIVILVLLDKKLDLNIRSKKLKTFVFQPVFGF